MRHAREEYGEPGSRRLRDRRRKYARRLRRLEPFRGHGQLVEIGCREGLFLDVAASSGWDVRGIEPEAETADLARERYDLDVHTGYLADAELPSASVDIVYLCEVIEHVDSPVPLFREVRRVLRPGGVVFCKTGNARSFSARWSGAKWSYYGYASQGHVSYFNPETARRLVETAGLELHSLRTWGIEMPNGLRRRLLGLYVRLTGQGGHMEWLARRI